MSRLNFRETILDIQYVTVDEVDVAIPYTYR